MKIIKNTESSISEIVEALKQGKTIIYPTETCYGLGCDATNLDAVAHIFDIKKRQKNKPILVIAADISMMMKYVEWNEVLQKLADRYWPGPLTLVVPTNLEHTLPAGVVSDDGTVAFRITNHPFAAQLSAGLERPIVSTSANIAEHESPYDIESVLQMYDGGAYQPDIIIDAGTLPHHSPSTVVRVVDGDMTILRQGEIVVDV